MEEIGKVWLDRQYVSNRMSNLVYSMDGANVDAIRNLFVQLFDRVEALEKRLTPTATSNKGEQS